MQEDNMRKPWLLVLLLLGAILPVSGLASAEDVPTYTISGQVYTSTGEPAGTTYVKVDSMESVLSSDGAYSFPGVTAGEHVVRAYFMNDGHTVAYRTIYIQGDTVLDWYEGHNWITVDALDAQGQHLPGSDSFDVALHELDETKSFTEGRAEFGPYQTGSYHTLSTSLNSSTEGTLVACLKLQPGSAMTPYVNHVQFQEGMNSVFGFLLDAAGQPAPDVLVAHGETQTTTNPDGFYSLDGLPIATEVNLTFTQSGEEVAPNLLQLVEYGAMWLNHTTSTTLEFPGNVSFITPASSVPLGPIQLEWAGGAYTDYFELYQGEISQEGLIYRGSSNSFEYTATESGTYSFHLVAHNVNGTSPNSASVLVLFLPTQSEDALWTSGMHWNYTLVHTPEYRSNRTFTAIGTEDIVDAFGRERSTYLVRITDDRYEEGEKAFRWIDTETFLPVKTYWADAPSSSSYFQEGSMGWMFTDGDQEQGLFGEEHSTELHFNRTNIIGVPGHPNGYDDTMNSVSVQQGVSITTAAGTFDCTYITIQDDVDGVLSWELWFNHTVQNYVKIVDRLPGSHSDMVVYELTGYNQPSVPEFLTEPVVQTSPTFELQWSEFADAQNFQLLENGNEIYRGSETKFQVDNRGDGDYEYQINAITELDYVLVGATLDLVVDFVPPVPEFTSSISLLNATETAVFSWEYDYTADWFAISQEGPDGEVVEVYNGSSTSIEVDFTDPGLHRFRLTAMVDGKLSEPSSSVFVTVEEPPAEDASEGFMPSMSLLSVIFVALCVVLFTEMRRSR
tara:strand:+ start:5570 stop:7930 length:2361 start_codon:yes stop_codon:yes gene_type:complete